MWVQCAECVKVWRDTRKHIHYPAAVLHLNVPNAPESWLQRCLFQAGTVETVEI